MGAARKNIPRGTRLDSGGDQLSRGVGVARRTADLLGPLAHLHHFAALTGEGEPAVLLGVPQQTAADRDLDRAVHLHAAARVRATEPTRLLNLLHQLLCGALGAVGAQAFLVVEVGEHDAE